MRLPRETSLQVLLVLITLIGYWPVIGFEYTLKWDIIDQYFPWRMFIVECLRSGVFPLWNPYEQLGTPIFADPQSGYWYAPVWLSALFGEYSLRSVQVEYFAHVALGGLGMFRLIRSFKVDGNTTFFLALAYVFSGFFIGNAQHLTYVVTGCWLPLVLWSFKDLFSNRGYYSVVRFSFFTWLLITGGYPAFSIILFYLLVVLLFIQLWKGRGNASETSALLSRCAASFLLLGVLLSGLIFTLWQGRPYFSRSEGLDYGVASFGPFSPQSMISFLFPLAAARNPEFFNTDISMSGAYLGWFALAGFILFVSKQKTRSDWMLITAVVFFLLASFGKYTPLHRFLFEHVPMMDWFRFPSVFRLFMMIGLLIASGLAFSSIRSARPLILLNGLLLILLLGVMYHFREGGGTSWPGPGQWSTFFKNIPFEKALVFQGVISAAAVSTGLLALSLPIRFQHKLLLIGTIGVVELVFFARMNMPVTVVSDYNTRETQLALDSARVRGFPIPKLHPVRLNQDSGPFPQPFWKNINLFRKQPAWDGYNNFQLKGYIRFFDQESLRSVQLSKPWVSFADTALTYSDSIYPAALEERNMAYLETRTPLEIPSGISDPNNDAAVIGFEPGRMTLTAHVVSDSALLVVMQQRYPGWEVNVDDKPVNTLLTDYLFQSVWLGKGNHRIDWVYRNLPVRILTILGFLVGALCAVFLSIPGLRLRR